MVRKSLLLVAGVGLLVAVSAVTYWAGTQAVLPPAIAIDTHPVVTYTVEDGEVARSVRITVAASWQASQTLFAGRSGTVTSLGHPAGNLADSGAVLATVDLEPLVAASGSVPMFRSLKIGVTGPDVRQFQELLTSLNHYDGAIDGRFGPQTKVATRRWQRSIRAKQDGVVETGSLLFIEDLPRRVELLLTTGEQVSIGQDLLRVLGKAPDFVAEVSASQRGELRSGDTVDINAPGGGSWTGRLGSFVELEDGRFSVDVTGALCAEECDRIPVSGDTALAGTVELVPAKAGPVVPTSALQRQPSGAVAVQLADGTLTEIRVLAEADGFAVISGIQPGSVIRLPAPIP